jgi:hypothetical protein
VTSALPMLSPFLWFSYFLCGSMLRSTLDCRVNGFLEALPTIRPQFDFRLTVGFRLFRAHWRTTPWQSKPRLFIACLAIY